MLKVNKDPVNGEDVLMVGAPVSTETEDFVTDIFETAVLTGALEKYRRFFDVPFQEFLDALEMNGTSVQVDLLATDPQLNFRRESGPPGSECDEFT